MVYAVAFQKKMTMLVFPYNAMYSVDFYHNHTGEVYVLKKNGVNIPISGKWYWKKDFLETSLRGFAHYIEDSNRVFLDHYIPNRFSSPAVQAFLKRKLTPGRINQTAWLNWYADFSGHPLVEGDLLELGKYRFDIMPQGFQIKDSTTIWKNAK